jgi:hypothetical protein
VLLQFCLLVLMDHFVIDLRGAGGVNKYQCTGEGRWMLSSVLGTCERGQTLFTVIFFYEDDEWSILA